jgi:hypothetical protein
MTSVAYLVTLVCAMQFSSATDAATFWAVAQATLLASSP